jgi:hypothetical protein
MSTSPISKTLYSEPERRYDITRIQGLKHPKCKKSRAPDTYAENNAWGYSKRREKVMISEARKKERL